MTALLVRREGPVKRLVLNRPEKRNALNVELATGVLDEFNASGADGTRLLVLSGEGPAFCAGFDFGAFPDCSDGDLLLQFVRIEQMLQAVAHAPFDTLACVQGRAVGAGADLALACGFRVGSRDASLMFPGARFGLVLGTRRLASRVGMERALLLAGGREGVGADDALRQGILTDVADVGDWPAHERRILEHILSIPADTRASLLDAMRVDTRTTDMSDLVTSASTPQLRSRLQAYLAASSAARRVHPAR